MIYQVKYRITGWDQEFESPTYETWEEASYQKDDIAGYEGVHDVHIVPVEESL